MPVMITEQVADSAAVAALCRALSRAYPFLRHTAIGHSVCGRPLHALAVGYGSRIALVAAAFHGQEWLTSLIALRLAEELCRLYQGESIAPHIGLPHDLSERTVVILPQVNPDGVDIAIHGSRAGGDHADILHVLGADIGGYWQANAHGIDLNHNFNAGREALAAEERRHGRSGPCARQWGGVTPESEPESAAVADLCRRVPFTHVAALHSQGEEIYWEYGERTPPHARMTARILGALSGYTPATPDAIASHGGFKDWFIEEFGRLGFTFELGRGRNPLPLSDFEPIWEKAKEMLLFTALM